MSTAQNSRDTLLNLLILEQEARRAQDITALYFTITNRTRLIFPYRQASLVRILSNGRVKIEAISDIPLVEQNTPFMQWLTRLAGYLAMGEEAEEARVVEPHALDDALTEGWQEWGSGYGLWHPLKLPNGRLVGGMIIMRNVPLHEREMVLLNRVGETFAHAWKALPFWRREERWARRRRKAIGLTLVVGIVAAGFLIPVRQSVLAPAQVAAWKPTMVSAPLDGVIATFHIQPNQEVTKNQVLFSYEGTELRSRLAVAKKSLAVSQVKYRTAAQGAFHSQESSAELALLKAETALRQVELEYAQSQVLRMEVRADRDGQAVFRDTNDWIGRPVRTGERILELANPQSVELKIRLPVREAMVLRKGSLVRFFMDIDPIHPLNGRLVHASYQAESGPDGLLAYEVTAALDPQAQPPRIGLRGTAKIHGNATPLFYYLFRRPLSAARQLFGF
ncbi:MAG: HlyD family efflux transporter periplasmic adaptor subunit [Magnetococcales bacterium]|nr:HlyD family efflux transporter periplasmic adaptor subunit [Magnetococcales bacterium]